MRRADNLTTFMYRLKILEALTSWGPWGLSRPVQGQLYLYAKNATIPSIPTNMNCHSRNNYSSNNYCNQITDYTLLLPENQLFEIHKLYNRTGGEGLRYKTKLCAVKEHGKSTGTAPRIPNPSTTWTWVVIVMRQLHYH